MKNRSVSIVIPNWNGKKLLEKNLPLVIANAGGTEVIVVDDASGDESVEFINNKFPEVKVVRHTRHQGFSSSVNAGVAKAGGKIVVLLNTDVVPERNFLSPLISQFKDKSVFAVGCLEKSQEKDEKVERGRGLAHWEKGFYIHARGDVDNGDTAWVSGGSGAFRRDLFLKFGGMNTLYNPFYWEDIDISYTARKAGYKVRFELKSVVQHFHGEGAIKQLFTVGEVREISFRNQFFFVWKNCSDWRIWMQHLMYVPLRIVENLVKGDAMMLQGWLLAIGKLPEVWMERKRVSKFWKIADKQIVTV